MITREEARRLFYSTPVYAITDEALSQGRSNIEVVKEMLEGGVRYLQYREKQKKGRTRYEECMAIRELARDYGCVFVVNDYVDLALAVDADGVHIGQDDLPPTVVRRLIGPHKILGLSTKNREEYAAAAALNEATEHHVGGPILDYVGVGPVYATSTKADASAPVGLSYVQYVAQDRRIPFVAIGGIKEHNLPDVIAAGAPCVVLISDITQSPSIADKVRTIGRIQGKY